ncbi:cytochrome c-type biogenesis protein CcmH [uncultured Shimia sp.]|uniref:cytochrome c-type biogenesis protein n=1 Tax=uncultured Shimia sp. TaxID=573152 RepID=UPI002608E771|nr:cytochrome c-type biogenesis protein CcmH [uncultured Shimia sp.]
MLKFLCSALVALTLATPAFSINPGEMFEDPAQEARAREIGRQLRCMVCQNQSIFDSNAGLANDLRVLVRERMLEGDTDDEVLSYVADRYGDYVLLEPTKSAKNAILWLTPAGALIFGLLGFALYIRQRKEPQAVEALTDADRAAAKHLLKQRDSKP